MFISLPELPRLPIENRLLTALPAQEYQRLVPHLELIDLSVGKVIYEPGEPIPHVYFPNKAIVSLITTMENGSTVEVGLVGNDGMVGLPVIWGGSTMTTRAFVQVFGSAIRIKAEHIKAEFDRGESLQALLLRYMQALFTQVSQTAACNCLHTIEERLARWLLIVSDYQQSDTFALTQEFIAEMLGCRRSGVTVAAGILSRAGIISYYRGKITVLNREGLEATSCECYRVIRDEFARLRSMDLSHNV